MQDRVHDTAADPTAITVDLHALRAEAAQLLSEVTDGKLLTTIRDALRESAREHPVEISAEERAWIESRVDGWNADVAAIRAGGPSYTFADVYAEIRHKQHD